MRKFLTSALAPALPVFLAVAVLAACGGTDGATDTVARAPAESRPKSDTSATSASPTTGAHTETTQAGTTQAPEADTYDDVHFVCPEGGMDEVVALQQAVDEGHQPWRLSGPDVAAACTFGAPDAQVEPAGTNRFQVSQPGTGQRVIVDLAQPLGPGTVWVVTSVTPLGDDGSTPTAPSPAPTITEVRIDPPLPQAGAFYTLPVGAGKVRLMTAADNVDRVRYFLVPTGTGTRDLAELIGDATSSETEGRTWWVYDWNYPDDAMLAHLLVQASGPGGTTEQAPFGFYHEN
jgi:hypothetical protein